MLSTTRFRHVRIVIPLLVLALIAAACAGDVGKYRDVAAGPNEDATRDVDPFSSPIEEDTRSRDVEAEGAEERGGLDEAELPDEAGSAPGPPEPDAPGRAPAGPAGAPGEDATTTGGDTGVTPTQIAVGLFVPKSGVYAAPTRNWPAAMQGAFDEVNDEGGIHGRQLVLKSYDDAGSDANTIGANHRRARGEVFAYITVVSTTSEILGPFANRDRVPLIYGAMGEELGRSLRYGFPAIPYVTTQARIMPSYILNRLDGRDKKIGVVFEDSQTFINAKDRFKAHAARAGLDIVVEQPVGQTQASCTNEVTNLRSRGAELVLLMNGPFAAICMYRDARTLGYRPVWTALGGTQSNLVAAASGGAADGVRSLSVYPTMETQAAKHYSATMRKYQPDSDADEDDTGLIPYGYAQLLIQALRETGPDLDRERFVGTMETKMTGFDSGYTPPPTFRPGDRSGPQMVAEMRCCTNNRWTTVDPTWREGF